MTQIKHRNLLWLATLLSVFFIHSYVLAADESVDYLTKIKPILAEKCYSCHGVLKQESELRLETRALMILGSESGSVVEPFNAQDSLIYQRVTADVGERMPPDGEGTALNATETRLLKLWIDQGAIAPAEVIPAAPQKHWAFQRIQRPEIPDNNSAHPIDAFLEFRRRQQGVSVQPAAERSILIRRLYLDLIGLPPTREQLHDTRPWEVIVDELLASPRHGERWARHWMDVWRYSDWYGLGDQLRYSQKHLWHWRDWIIESLNEDKGYDQMIVEMLAADEVLPENPSALRATGFLARNYYLFNRTTWLDSTIEHTGKAFLGLTLNCCKCHDHKYDPISQRDYYQFRAIFEPHQIRLDQLPGEADLDRAGLPRAFDDHLEIATYLHIRGDEKNPDKQTIIEPAVPKLFADFAPAIQAIELPAFAYAPGTRDYVQQGRLKTAMSKLAETEQQLAEVSEKLKLANKLASETQPLANEQVIAESPEKAFSISDDFDQLDQQRWEVIGSGWVCRDGKLQQTEITREQTFVRLREPLPADFHVTCRYTTTGGSTYKSVTFRFDRSTDFKYDNFVYTSAHAPGPKLQVAFSRDGNTTYPADGMRAQKIEIGQTYDLRFAVRERLVNVWLDDEFILAYELPDRQPSGSFTLSGFDATVAFDSIQLDSLDADFEMIPAGNTAVAKDDPEFAFELARKQRDVAAAELAGLQATIAADKARVHKTVSPEQQSKLAIAAAKQQAAALKALAEYELLAAGSDTGKQNAAKAKLTRAEQEISRAGEGSEKYEPLKASRKALETPEHSFDDYPAVFPNTSTGRRTALARWMISRDNPLAARVAVNQVWMRHFGQPLVESVFDFGLRAPRPEQAELLDFLAIEFIESGWSFRHLHRLIVTSAAYQMSSSTADADEATVSSDPENQSYWHMPDKRMESELVRDSLLSLADQLDQTIGGPPVKANQASNRRSIYFVHSGDEQDKFLSMFDDADLLQCYRRTESIVPQQALALSNSKLSLAMADRIAANISAAHAELSQAEFIRIAFETLLARLPSDAEQDACEDYCEQLNQIVGAKANQELIRKRIVHALLNHNDFISIR